MCRHLGIIGQRLAVGAMVGSIPALGIIILTLRFSSSTILNIERSVGIKRLNTKFFPAYLDMGNKAKINPYRYLSVFSCNI